MAVITSKAITRAASGHTYSGETDLTVMCCPSCGITYAIPEVLRNAAEQAGERRSLTSRYAALEQDVAAWMDRRGVPWWAPLLIGFAAGVVLGAVV
jgi:hypothetical protein